MPINELTPMLYVSDLPSTIDFYVKTLDFNCDNYSSEWGWAQLSKDNIKIMLSKPNEHIPFEKPAFTGSFYFNTDDVDKWWDLVKDKARICYPLEDFEYGMREFAVYDCNGYLLQFGQEV
jgi:uncharacterized glyoxalase superfamily protein PhnB